MKFLHIGSFHRPVFMLDLLQSPAVARYQHYMYILNVVQQRRKYTGMTD